MSLYYRCTINLNAPFNDDNRLTIIRTGKRLGFIYFNLQDYSSDLDVSIGMSAEDALNYLIMGEIAKKDDINFPKNLTAQYEDTIFTINFYEENFCIHMHFFVLESPWKKSSCDEVCLDFGRYVKLWIDMCADFCIYKIETLID